MSFHAFTTDKSSRRLCALARKDFPSFLLHCTTFPPPPQSCLPAHLSVILSKMRSNIVRFTIGRALKNVKSIFKYRKPINALHHTAGTHVHHVLQTVFKYGFSVLRAAGQAKWIILTFFLLKPVYHHTNLFPFNFDYQYER